MAIKIDQRSKDSTYIETGSLTINIEHSPNCAEDFISVWNKNVEDKIQTTDLTDVYARISEVETKIKPTDLTNVYAEIAKVREELASLDIPETVNLKPLVKALQELEKAVAIVQKENQVQDAMIEEIKLKANNPLAN